MAASWCWLLRLCRRRGVALLLVVAVAAAVMLLLTQTGDDDGNEWHSHTVNGKVTAVSAAAAAARADAASGKSARQSTRQTAAVGSSAALRRFVAGRPVGCWRVPVTQMAAQPALDDGDRVLCAAAALDGTAPKLPAQQFAGAAAYGGVGDAAKLSRPRASYVYVACFVATSTIHGTARASVAPMTIERCLRACDDSGHAYAALEAADVCLCLAQHPAAGMLPDRRCQLPCAGDRRWLCGGRGSAAVYHLRSPDGATEWTAWMTSPRGDSGNDAALMAVRFRDCDALQVYADDLPQGRRCKAQLERRLMAAGSPSPTPPSLLRHFVGCYAVATNPSSTLVVTFRKNSRATAASCLRACAKRGFAYAFLRLLTGGCSCSRTLGVSRPVTFCDGVYGLPFYVVLAPPEIDGDVDYLRGDKPVRAENSTAIVDCAMAVDSNRSCSNRRSDGGYKRADSDRNGDKAKSDNAAAIAEAKAVNVSEMGKTSNVCSVRRSTVELHFDRSPPDKRHVLLLAYHRSGSTYASELVSKHPGALYSFEPDVIYSGHPFALGEYDDIEQLHREFYRAFDRLLRCDVHRLPLIWMRLGSFFPRPFEHSPRMSAYIGCQRTHGPVACAPYFQAQCEAASIVSAKTIRLTATPQTAAFVRANPSLVVLHLMRDPRAVVSSRKLVGAFSASGVRDLCNNMQRTAHFVNQAHAATAPWPADAMPATKSGVSSRRLFNVYYEDLVLEPLRSARYIYASMLRLNISRSTEWRLRVITGEKRDSGPRVHLLRRYTTRKKDPEKSLLKWQEQLSEKELDVVRWRCAAVLRWYPVTNFLNSTSTTPRG